MAEEVVFGLAVGPGQGGDLWRRNEESRRSHAPRGEEIEANGEMNVRCFDARPANSRPRSATYPA